MDEAKQAIAPDGASAGPKVAPAAPDPLLVEAEPAAPEGPREGSEPGEWDAVRRLALRQLDRFMSFEPKVLRGDDPDAIHDMRVASRRLQQILDLLYPQPRPHEVRGLRRRLRRARRCLSEVRNCDVLLVRVNRRLASKRTARREVWTAVAHYLRQRRQASFTRALRKLSKLNLAVFYVYLKDHLTLPGERPDAVHRGGGARSRGFPELARGQFYERVSASLDRVWRAFDAQLRLAHQDPRGPVIHGARIATKRLRYLIEVIGEFGVAGSRQNLAWLRSLQTLLGDWHDLEVLEEMMIGMVARPEFLRDHLALAVSVERQIARLRSSKRGYQEKFFGMTLESPDLQQLGEWAAYLLESPSEAFATA